MWGLQSLSCCQQSGELLPRLSTLTIFQWRFISVALALKLPSPDVIRHIALWSSDFPHIFSYMRLLNLLTAIFILPQKFITKNNRFKKNKSIYKNFFDMYVFYSEFSISHINFLLLRLISRFE